MHIWSQRIPSQQRSHFIFCSAKVEPSPANQISLCDKLDLSVVTNLKPVGIQIRISLCLKICLQCRTRSGCSLCNLTTDPIRDFIPANFTRRYLPAFLTASIPDELLPMLLTNPVNYPSVHHTRPIPAEQINSAHSVQTIIIPADRHLLISSNSGWNYSFFCHIIRSYLLHFAFKGHSIFGSCRLLFSLLSYDKFNLIQFKPVDILLQLAS